MVHRAYTALCIPSGSATRLPGSCARSAASFLPGFEPPIFVTRKPLGSETSFAVSSGSTRRSGWLASRFRRFSCGEATTRKFRSRWPRKRACGSREANSRSSSARGTTRISTPHIIFMALSERLRRIANAILPFWDALYILQLEEYRVGRLAKWLPRFFFRRNVARRQQLRYTQRAKTIFAASLFLWVLAAVVVATSALPLVVRVGLIGVLCTFGHAFVAAGTWALWPVHHVAALRAMRRAASVVASRKEMRVVAVAGSYGKTTTKQFVYDLARHVLPTQMVPGTINTPRGIAAWILKDLRPSTELLVVEMDAYQVGEIARSCKIAPPDIAVITNVGDQHLERFGSVDRLASAPRETIFGSKPTATVVFDEETYSR